MISISESYSKEDILRFKSYITKKKTNYEAKIFNIFEIVFDGLNDFSNESKNIEFLEKYRWGGVPVCECGCVFLYNLSRPFNYKCKSCKKIFNVRTGSILENSKLSLSHWFQAITILKKEKISSHKLAKKINITQKSAYYLSNKITRNEI